MSRSNWRPWILLAAASFIIAGAGAAALAQQKSPEAPPLPNPKSYTAHLVGHAHIDLSWLWRWEETVNDIAVKTFAGTLAEMAKLPGLTFAQSQAAVYEAMEKSYPALFEAIARKIKEGTWVPVGGMWAEPDLNMPDGEALARQLLYGKRYFLEKFGVDVTVGWNPDAFGHNGQLPQILRRAGIADYVFERCAPRDAPFFRWEGIDGSRLLAHVPQGWYLVSLKDGLSKILKPAAGQTPVKDFLILYGEGDHGGGPRDSDIAAIKRLSGDPAEPRIMFDTPEAFFKKIESSGADIPVVKGELNFTFPGCYTTQSASKKMNRSSEGLLLQAERLSALAVSSGYRDYYPERDLDEAWKIVLRNQFHDILDGSSIGPVYEEAGRAYADAQVRGRRAADFSLETILSQVDTRGEGIPVAVFNTLFWPRTDTVTAEAVVVGVPAGLRLLDASGNAVPVQILERTTGDSLTHFRFLFTAADVPSFGYRIYRAVAADRPAEPVKSGLAVTSRLLENEFFRVELDETTGWIKRLYDKRAGREVLSGPGNVLQSIADEPDQMSAWELGLRGDPLNLGQTGAVVQVVEPGPARVTVRTTIPFMDSLFQQDLSLSAGVARVDCRTKIDWQERNLMIKAAFPVDLKAPQAWFEIPFGAISRPPDGTEVPALRWVDISDPAAGYGLSLVNDGKYGFDVNGSTLRMSVVRGATYPDPEADRGLQEFAYALVPHTGTWMEAGTIRRGYELNNPLIAKTLMTHKGALPAERSFGSSAPAGVVLSTFKMESGYNSRSVIIRVYESFGRKTTARLSLPWPARAEETDLIERPVKGGLLLESKGPENEVEVDLGPYAIRTFKVTRLK